MSVLQVLFTELELELKGSTLNGELLVVTESMESKPATSASPPYPNAAVVAELPRRLVRQLRGRAMEKLRMFIACYLSIVAW